MAASWPSILLARVKIAHPAQVADSLIAAVPAPAASVIAVGRAVDVAAPAAVRLSVPEANPTYSLTAALAITFPFNISLGIPLFFEAAKLLHA